MQVKLSLQMPVSSTRQFLNHLYINDFNITKLEFNYLFKHEMGLTGDCMRGSQV